ncbi:DUF6268 family outer membrane beta-barrel protein [Antarcticibacterium sp. 1MA-6-2]|uniref:DUF6268 family outer membrane beta-barrel protein n=1 Tax=Antarcticibacterium sp. 1MA-6-2 TaxID=2908210 RepID=UPI001F1D3EA1|nr:DUF6268 family outer membrane beta-barrel protein [Antarcticibacterium sp. 1MA-6-2]UJH92580.1 DUF6268 family outer membrane beta-barrel protein [Antarcticibacterium sp. 1MA-6-2]
MNLKKIKFYHWCVFLLLAGVTDFSQAQSTDLARIEYTYFPQSSSDNSFRRFRTFVNFPIKLGEDAYLVPGLDYENINFKYEDNAPFGNLRDLDRYQSFTATLGFTDKISEKWRYAVQGGLMLASNFELGKIINDDLLYTGAVLFINDSGKEGVEVPWRLILGLHYSTTSGFPFPLPIVNYYREFHPNWSYTLGVPKSNLKYYIDKKNELQAFVTLDGFFANIQENREVEGSTALAENISMTIVLAGIGYEYNFTDHLVYYVYAGHTIRNDIRIRDDNRDDVYDINRVNTFYGRTGLKFKI